MVFPGDLITFCLTPLGGTWPGVLLHETTIVARNAAPRLADPKLSPGEQKISSNGDDDSVGSGTTPTYRGL